MRCLLLDATRRCRAITRPFSSLSSGAGNMGQETRKIRAAMIDLSGTLHIDDQVLPGALEGVDLLRRNGIALKFVTNTTKESRFALLTRLRNLGFVINDAEILTSLTAAKRKIVAEGLRPMLFLEDSALEEFDDVPTRDFDSVVVGLAPKYFNYDNMSAAMNVLLDGGKLIAIHKARYYKAKDGTLKAGPGCFVSGLEFSSGVVAHVVGKPEPNFFNAALEAIEDDLSLASGPLLPAEVAMIGDDAKDDVAGAKAVGCRGILVKTGKYRDGDEERTTPAPDAICDDFLQAAKLIVDGRL